MAMIFVDQNAIRQRSLGGYALIESLHRRNQLVFDGGLNEVIFNLDCCKTRRPESDIAKCHRVVSCSHPVECCCAHARTASAPICVSDQKSGGGTIARWYWRYLCISRGGE